AFGKVSLANAACAATFTAEAGLVGDKAVQELQVRAAILGRLGQGSVQVRGGQGNAQHREVGQDAFTQVLRWQRRPRSQRRWQWRTAGHGWKSPDSVSVDRQPSVALSRDRRAGTAPSAGVLVRPSWPGCSWVWRWRPG